MERRETNIIVNKSAHIHRIGKYKKEYKYLSSEPRHGSLTYIFASDLESHEEVGKEIARLFSIEPLMLQERVLIDKGS